MMFLAIWYLMLCFVVMPLDSFLSTRRRLRLPPPLATLLYLIGAALFYRPSLSDIEEARATVAIFRAMPIEWQWIIGIVIAMPILWQATGAYLDWREVQ